MEAATRSRLGIRAGDEAAIGAMVAAFLALRVIAIRTTPLVYFDSGDYRHLDLFGGGRRPPTIPLLYDLVPTDGWRVLEQAVISAGAWLAIALVVAAGVTDRCVRLGAVATFLALGLTTQVTSWDSAILSDSITISLTVLVVAAWIAVHRSPSTTTVALALAAMTAWTFARELHVYVTAGLAAITIVVAVVRRGRAPWLALAIGLGVLSLLAFAADRRNQETAVQNLAGVIGGRILPDADARAWFVDAGMPALAQLPPGQAVPDKTLLAIDEFDRWVRRDGLGTYARYLLTHPAELVTGPYGELLEERETYAEKPSTRAVLLSPAEAYGRARPVLPAPVEDVLFAPGRTGAVLALAAVALAGALAVRLRAGPDRRRVVPLVVVALVLPYVALAWHGSVFEPGRHAMPGAVALRVGLLALLAVTLDQLLVARADARPSG